MGNSLGCENCAVHGIFVRQTIKEVPGKAGMYALTSLTGNAQRLVALETARVCAGSAIEDDVPEPGSLIHSGELVDVTIDRVGVARKLGPFAVEGGHVCIRLFPFGQNDMSEHPMPEETPAHV